MNAKLTKQLVSRIRPSKADLFVWDSELKGFGLKVTPVGRKVFVFQYRHKGESRRATVGTFGQLTVELARGAATRLAGLVAGGRDPVREQRSDRAAEVGSSVADLAPHYLAEVAAKKRPRTLEAYEAHFRLHIIPAFGKKPVARVTPRDVQILHAAMRQTPVSANRVAATLGAFFRWCERRGYVQRGMNPSDDIDWYKERSRERFLSTGEIARLGEALVKAEREGLPPAPRMRRRPKSTTTAKHRPKGSLLVRANPFATAAIRFLLFTGWREQEALTLKWSDVDFERASATLADTKTGKSHRLIGAPALDLISDLPRIAGNPYVFAGTKPGQPLQGVRRTWYAARHAAGLEGVRLHDLRHTVASFAIASGHSLVLTGALLGHANASTTAKYAHLTNDARRAVADTVAGALSAALSDHQPLVSSASGRLLTQA